LTEFRGHLEVHNVAGVVLDDVENASAAVDGSRSSFDLVRRGRSEHLTETGGIQHSFPNKSHVHGFVTAATSRHDGDFARDRRIGANHIGWVEADLENIRMRQSQAGERLAPDVLRIVNRRVKNSLESILASDWLAACWHVPPEWGMCQTGARSGGDKRQQQRKSKRA
jgi:hypothetical protein